MKSWIEIFEAKSPEEFAICDDFLLEGEKDDSKKHREMRLKVKVSEADKINGNGRYYPKNILEREVNKLNNKVEKRAVFAALDHPEGGERPSLGNVSGIPKKIWMEGDNVWAVVDIPKTEKGRDLAAIIRAGGRPGVSKRGTGSLAEGTVKIGGQDVKTNIIQDDYNLKTFDFVMDQSESSAGIYSIAEHLERAETEVSKTNEDTSNKETKMTLKEWLAKYSEAAKSLAESLKGASFEDLQVLSKDTFEAARAAVIAEFESEVNEKVMAHIETYCEGIRNEVTADELAEAEALGAAKLLKDLGIEEAGDTVSVAKLKAIMAALQAAVKDPTSDDAQNKKLNTGGKGEALAVKEAVEAAVKAAILPLTDRIAELEGSSKQSNDQLKNSKVEELISKFPYNDKAKAHVKSVIEKCETAAEAESAYNTQITLLQEAGLVASKANKGSAKFISSDDNDEIPEGDKFEGTHGMKTQEEMIAEASEDYEKTPSLTEEIK